MKNWKDSMCTFPFTFSFLCRYYILLPLILILSLACNSSEPTERVRPLPEIQFTDISPSSGVSFKHANGKSGRYYFIETVASGGGFIDYDGDGDLDIYLLNGTDIPGFEPEEPLSNVLYRNNGDGTFIDVTEESGVGNEGGYGMGLAVADYDNDGDDDLFLTNFGENVLYRNNGDGTFTDATLQTRLTTPRNPMFSTSAAFVDYDRDGHLDLFVCGYVDFTFESNKRCVRDNIRSYCDPDVYNGVADLLFHNNGDGTFTDVSAAAGIANPEGKGLGVVCGDYDGDGWPDIFVANDRTPNFLYHNNGDGTFTDEALLSGVAYGEDGIARAGMGADFGDYDHNGSPDIYVTNFSMEPNSLFRNNANGTFTETTFGAGVGNPTLTFLAFGTAFFDYDNDGWLDLFAANGHVIDNVEKFDQSVTYAETNQIFRNNRDGRFTDVSDRLGAPFQVRRVHRAAAFGDMDNDGDIDVLVTNVNGRPELLRNDGGNQQHSLLIGAVGNRSNRNGIGAQITVVAGDLRQHKEVRTTYSFMSSNDARVHFGLGAYTAVDSIIVDWPSGVQDRLADIHADQRITIEEGAGVVSQMSFPAR
jgi:hypothetical protein